MMRLTADYPHDEFVGLSGAVNASYRVRVFQSDPGDPEGRAAGPVVLLTLEEDERTSEPSDALSAVEFVAAEVLVRFSLPPLCVAFIEHRPRLDVGTSQGLPDAYDLLTFRHVAPKRRQLANGCFALTLGSPGRQPLSPALVENLLACQAPSQEGSGRGGDR